MHSIVQSRIPIPSQFSRRILNTCAHQKEVGACRRSHDDFFVHLEDVHGVPRRVIVPLLDGDVLIRTSGEFRLEGAEGFVASWGAATVFFPRRG